MDDFDVQGKERELDELLSEVKSWKKTSRCGKTRWKTPGCRTKHRKDR